MQLMLHLSLALLKQNLVRLLEKFNLKDELKLFENLAIKSNKWKKWLYQIQRQQKEKKY